MRAQNNAILHVFMTKSVCDSRDRIVVSKRKRVKKLETQHECLQIIEKLQIGIRVETRSGRGIRGNDIIHFCYILRGIHNR